MTKRFKAVFADGLLRPLEPLNLPEQEQVECMFVRGGAKFSDVPLEGIPEPPRGSSRLLPELQHELSRPVFAARSAISLLRDELVRYPPLPHPYLEDAEMWLDLMTHLIYGLDPKPRDLNLQPAWMLADVVAPSIRHIQAFVKERGFSVHNIRYDGTDDWKHIPELQIDREQMCQVFFNLLSNAIKYAFADPAAFAVEIRPETTRDAFAIRVRDYGIGVDPDAEPRIFELGFRGEAARPRAIGSGVGLAIAKDIVERHGGTLALTNRHLPTEFTLTLPKTVARGKRFSRNSSS